MRISPKFFDVVALDKLKENQKYWETTTGLNKKQASICWVNCTFEIWYFMILSFESSSWLNNWNNISLKIEYEKKKLGNVLKKVFSSDLILEDFPDCYSEKKKIWYFFVELQTFFEFEKWVMAEVLIFSKHHYLIYKILSLLLSSLWSSYQHFNFTTLKSFFYFQIQIRYPQSQLVWLWLKRKSFKLHRGA